MHRVVANYFLVVTVGVLSLLAGRSASAQSGVLVESGRADFKSYCAACHGIDARGDGPLKPALVTPPADLTTIAQRNGGRFDAGKVAGKIDGRFEVVAHGTAAMPVWGRILGKPISEGTTADEVARGQIDALVSYLQSIQR